MIKKIYPTNSWIDPRLSVHSISIAGHGLFADRRIRKGEVIIRWGGVVFSRKDILSGVTNEDTACQIDDEHYIASAPDHGQDPEDFMNHSCDPNTWMEDEVTISARKDIEPGEEVTADYALWVAEDNYELISDCHCGTSHCRHKITGDDWKLIDIQKRYKKHFPPYLKRRIKALTHNS